MLDRIADGTFQAGQKVPSENEIAALFAVSRLTVHRAFRELVASGALQRVQGVGTFVAPPKAASTLIRLHNIADDIRNRGQRLTSQVQDLSRVKPRPDIARFMELKPGGGLFRSLVVYCADQVPVQIEDRYVLPAFAPAYLQQDYLERSTTDYLQSISPATRAEHELQAVLPSASEAKLLEIDASEPCLLVKRKTWVNDMVTTYTRFLHPGSRHRFVG